MGCDKIGSADSGWWLSQWYVVMVMCSGKMNGFDSGGNDHFGRYFPQKNDGIG